jgi:predicted nucleotidyltransferase
MATDLDTETREKLSARIRDLPFVRLAYLFGSRARGRAREDSDIDVAVLTDDDRCADAEEHYQTLLAILDALDGVSAAELDIVLLNEAPPLLRHRVLRDGVLLFARSPEERVRFAIRAIRDHQDGEVRREEFLRRGLERMKRGRDDGGQGRLLEAARDLGRLLRKAQGIPRRT